MSIKINSNKHLKIVLEKYDIQENLEFFSRLWTNSEPASSRSLKKHFISSVTGIDYKDINLYVNNVWEDMKLPSDDVFVDIYRALVTDHKRSKRGETI